MSSFTLFLLSCGLFFINRKKFEGQNEKVKHKTNKVNDKQESTRLTSELPPTGG